MPYSVEFRAGAANDFSHLDTETARQVREKLNETAGNAESVRHRALTGPLRGLFRLRVGDYRVLYTLDRGNRNIIVRAVKHRSEVYRGG
jgi:mRNA interferase RelE/StbE